MLVYILKETTAQLLIFKATLIIFLYKPWVKHNQKELPLSSSKFYSALKPATSLFWFTLTALISVIDRCSQQKKALRIHHGRRTKLGLPNEHIGVFYSRRVWYI